MKLDNYECDGQMSIFDLIEYEPEEEKSICTSMNECEAYPQGCGGTIEPCRFGGPFKWPQNETQIVCKFSGHSCNKENLWEVAEMDGGTCNRVCCRQCDLVGCGARCNGSEEPKTLQPGQRVYVVKKGDVREAKVLDETRIYGSDNHYRLQYTTGTYDVTSDAEIDKKCFRDMGPAVAKAEKFLATHEVIRAEDIHAVSTVAYQYIRECDGYIMTAFYCELDNGMLYMKEFYTFHHILVDKRKQKKALKKFMEQNEIVDGSAVQIEYEPIFKNMYKIRQAYDWDYTEAEHTYAVG